jgi:hypothetical protein
MGKLKIRNTLAIESFTRSLVQAATSEIKEIPAYETMKLSPQLISDVMKYCECEIERSRYKSADISRTELVKAIMGSVFELNESEMDYLDKSITHLIDSGVLKKNYLKKFGKLVVRLVKWVLK